jgi:dipeptidyl aminopeptidase/acylaminoacyl peptidase
MFNKPSSPSTLLPFMACYAGLALLPGSPAWAQKHFPTNEEIRQVRTASSPELSPDGKQVVAEITESTADGGQPHIWLLSVQGTDFRQLTFAPAAASDTAKETSDNDAAGRGGRGPAGGETGAQWMPDGNHILFLARRGSAQQIFSLAIAGGQPAPLQLQFAGAERAPEVQSFAISPDGKMLAVVARDPEPADTASRRKAKDDARWIDHDLRTRRLYIVNLSTLTASRVQIEGDVDSPEWNSSSSQLLAISHAPDNDLGPSNVGWIVPADTTATPKRIEHLPPTAQHLLWAQGDRTIVYFGGCKEEAPAGCLDLYTYDLAKQTSRDISAGFDGSLSSAAAVVEPDGGHVLLTAAVGVQDQVLRFDLLTGKSNHIDFGMPVISAISSNASHTGWTYLAADSQSAANVYYRAADASKGERLAQPVLIPSDWQLAQPKVIHWKDQGLTIEGLLYLPPQAANQKVPLIVHIHGGPTGVFNDRLYATVNMLVGQGWAVLEPNPRGSTGYGAAFEAANKNDLGGKDFLDVMTGVDEAIRSYPIDPNKLALIGYSYGGEMAGFAEGKTDRFKSLVCGAPVINQFSEYGTESGSWGDRWYYGKPWEQDHFEDAWRQSPLATAQHGKTPILLLQGEADTTDPMGQSQEMYRALRQEGVPVEMVTYPRENHGELHSNFYGETSPEPMHGVDLRRRMVEFIERGFGTETATR